MVREMVRRHVVRISLVSSIGLALVSLLLFLASQPHQAFAKTDSLGVLRQTGTGDVLSITSTTGMNNVEMEAMGHAMSHLIMALDVLHEMQQQHTINASATMGEMGATTGTTDTTAMGSSADAGTLIVMMGHMAESMGYMHEAMGYRTLVAGAADTGASMNGGGADLSPMLDILDQMVQATISQVPTLSGMPGATATGTTTDTIGTDATDAATDTLAMGAMTGAFDPSPMLPAMAQTLQAMAGQLRGMMDTMNGMTGATDTGATATTTDTADMGTDMMSTETPSLRHALQAMGQSMELMGHMHMMLATVNSVSDTGAATVGTGDDMMGLINEMAQAMSDQVSVLTGGDTSGMGATGTTTDTTGTGTATSAMTDTTGMTDTNGMTGTADRDTLSMGMNSANPALSSAAQLIQIALLQIQGMTGGMAGGTAQ